MSISEAATKGVTTLAATTPHLLCLILVVGSFLFYLDKKNVRDAELMRSYEVVAEQRFQTANAVSERQTEATNAVSKSLDGQEDMFKELLTLIEMHLRDVN